MRYIKKQNIVCFTPIELKELYKGDKLEKLHKTISEKGLTLSDLIENHPKQREVVDASIKEDLKSKEQVEILAALNSCIVFYGENSEVGFPLKKSYDILKNPIRNLADLKNATEEETMIDFAIISEGLMYQFQFKRYRDILETENFLSFIKKMLKKYGDKLGKLNLLIILQGLELKEIQKINIDFKKIREELLSQYPDLDGFVLVRFNEDNRFNYLVEVYPGMTAVKVPINPNYLAGKLMYN